jgi:SAM-dependent methyltransferase
MKNRDAWTPTKYVYENEKLRASRDPKEVGIGSRLIVDIIAQFYHENLQRHAKGRLLDLGCGKVPLFCAYRDYISDNICVDWANTLHKNVYLDFECDLTKPLPFQDEEFDTIILSDVLEHITQPDILWKEMSRMLSVDGKIIVNVPFYYWLHEKPHDYYRYTEFALRRFVENSGLKVIQLKSIGGAPEIMADIFAKNILRVPRIGRLLALFAQWITFSFIQTAIGKKISEETMNSFPFGYFLIAQKSE